MTQRTKNTTANTSTTSVQILDVAQGYKRTQLIITNTSAAAVVTLAKGDIAAVAGAGIVLQPGQIYAEGTDGGYTCWQGQVQVVSTAAGSVGITESSDS